MSKLKSAILYEYSTKIKAMVLFYLIQYLIVALIFSIVAISVGGEEIGSNALEFSSVIFISVIGVLGYKEDFKALIQNGYTRKYIFGATICMFTLLAGTMALIDTIIGNSIHYFNDNYFTLFGSLYGYGNVFLNWLWLTVLYLMFCSLFYFAVLVINRVGKMVSLFIGVGLSCVILLVTSLFRFVFSQEFVSAAAEFVMKAMGFMSNGTTNLFFPILSFLVIGVVFGIGSYAVIRRTELK
mgnify:FL=1